MSPLQKSAPEGKPALPPRLETRHTFKVTQQQKKHYACGCTTTRIETIFLPSLQPEYCATHNAPLQKTSRTFEYAPAPDPPP
jgi:hypothetical protein